MKKYKNLVLREKINGSFVVQKHFILIDKIKNSSDFLSNWSWNKDKFLYKNKNNLKKK